jgi:hypothetical protein
VGALLLLGSLPGTWEAFKVTVCSSTPNDVVTWNLVKNKVLNEEYRKTIDKNGSSSHSEVLVTQSRGRSKSRGPSHGEEEVETNQKASLLIWCAITEMRKATTSGIVNKGTRIKRKDRRIKFRNKMTLIVAVMKNY